MLTRRHIRIKVLQSIYAFTQRANADLEEQEKFLNYSIVQMTDLYLLLIQLLVELRNQADDFLQRSQQKFLATELEKNPSRNFVDNKVFQLISSHEPFAETIENKRLNYWEQDSDYVAIIFKELREKDWYTDYLKMENPTFRKDRDFILRVYKEIIAPNDKLYEYLEDKRLTWIDDFPIVNTAIVKMLSKFSEKNVSESLIPELFKNKEDYHYALELFRKVVLNEDKLNEEVSGKTTNWDQERIAEVDLIILKMGIAEFLYFPSIPVRATINEYLEISKEYSTPKSSIFINGILDNVAKDFETNGKLNKIGRGLR